MESFHWDKAFITGLAEVDEQHHHLVDLINQFGEMLAKNELHFDDIEGIFKQLADYAQFHFQDEEELMSKKGIDPRHLDSHIQIHQGFLQEVTTLHSELSPQNMHSAENLFKFLTYWLAYHILGSDQNMARQIDSIRSGLTASEAYEKDEKRLDSATEPLLKALNGLFNQVALRNKELVNLNLTLEEKVTERTKDLQEANLQLEELSLTDVLTGLPNRRHALRQLSALWKESEQENIPLSCMMIDADHFKEVNDTYGHDAGDDVLRELASTLQHAVRNDDIVCRLGGDEFLILCPNTDHNGGMYIAEIIRKQVAELRVTTGSGVWQGSISVGFATRSDKTENHEALIKQADEGVYMAKRDGKNCVRTNNSNP